jgi:hypothetical protein
LGLALDEQKETDELFEIKGYTFLVDKSLIQTAAPIVVDGTPYGFKVTSQLSANAGSSCSACSSCG